MRRDAEIIEEELHAWLDGQLPPDRMAAVGAHVAADPVLAARLEAYRQDAAGLRRVFGRAAQAAERVAPESAARRPRRAALWLRRAAAVLVVATSLATGWGVHELLDQDENAFAREAAALHAVRGSLADRAASAADETLVTDALAAVIGGPVPYPEMTEFGYRLASVRKLPEIGDEALQLVYEPSGDGGVPISVYLRRKPGATETELQLAHHGTINVASWDLEDVSCAISGAVDPEVLGAVGRKLYKLFDRT